MYGAMVYLICELLCIILKSIYLYIYIIILQRAMLEKEIYVILSMLREKTERLISFFK